MSGSGLALVRAQIPFGDRAGLDDVNLEVARGQRLALLGPSGVGKTSVLRAVAGLGPVSSGAVLVDGRDVTTAPPERRGVVYMHQSPFLFPHLTVLDNVTFPLDIRGVPKIEARASGLELLDRVQMRFAAEREPATLSGGQRHRVALARALAAEPAVLLLDEPFAALDPELRADVRTAVIEILARGAGPAVVLVTHDVDEAAGIADRLAVLLNGRIAQVGPAAELLAAPSSVAIARFLGLPNLIAGVRDGRGVVSSAVGSFQRSGPAGPVTVISRAGALRARAGDTASAAGTVWRVLDQVGGVAVVCDVGGQRVLAVPEPGFQPIPGSPIDLVVDAASLHVIDEHLNRT
jgi:putative spermidine/putrescine transport system ATP-binding protein